MSNGGLPTAEPPSEGKCFVSAADDGGNSPLSTRV